MSGKRTRIVCLLSAFLLVLAALAWYVVSGVSRRQGPVRRIVLISIDTCRADYVGCYSPDWPTTPNIDAFAQQATLFENAKTPVPITLPAHCSMLTGLVPPAHGVRCQPYFKLSSQELSLATVLQAGGYSTGAIVSSFVLNEPLGLEQGFDTYNNVFRNPLGERVDERRGEDTSDIAIEWLGEHKDDEKFFLFVHYYDPHVPYEAPAQFADRFGADDREQYAAEIAYVDHCVGKVFDELKRLGLYDDSLIIVTSDHGEMLGEHGEATHQYFIYESAIRVPLLVKLPGQSEAKRISEVVGLIDIVPTVYSLVGVKRTPPVDGIDLTPLLVGDRPSSELAQRELYCESVVPYFYGANPLFGQVGSRWKYIRSVRPELYDLQADPSETTNLLDPAIVTDPEELDRYANRARVREDEIMDVLAASLGVDLSGARASASEEALHRMASLGYVSVSGEGTFEFQETRKDAKDTLRFHRDCEDATRLAVAGDKEQAIAILEAVVIECPALDSAQKMLARLRDEIGQYDE